MKQDLSNEKESSISWKTKNISHKIPIFRENYRSSMNSIHVFIF